MKDNYYQCQSCGHIHKIKNITLSDEELFTYIECPHCKKKSQQLLIGDRIEDIPYYYNANIDPRYFKYNKSK